MDLKIVLLASVGVIALSLAACSNVSEEKTPSKVSQKVKLRDREKPKFHGDMDTSASKAPSTPVVKLLKDNHLDVSATKTIGEAFDNYKFAAKKEWRETAPPNGPYYIDYICWLDMSPFSSVALKEGVVRRRLEIKFLIHKDGVTYIAMASLVDVKTDGMIYTTVIEPPDIKKIVTAIYDNREIVF
jgi:hypothetical protein